MWNTSTPMEGTGRKLWRTLITNKDVSGNDRVERKWGQLGRAGMGLFFQSYTLEKLVEILFEIAHQSNG